MREIIKKFGKNILAFKNADDGADASVFLQRAFDSGEGMLYLPAGTYTVQKPLRIRSDTRLVLDEKARIVAGNGAMTKRGDFLIRNADLETGNKNISITGGVWDGNFRENPKSDIHDDKGYSGAMLNFVNVRNLCLKDMTLHNSAAYYTRFAHLSEFVIEDIRLSHDVNVSNNDGIHFCGFCENGVVRKIHGVTRGTPNDDLIAINADDCPDRTENRDLPQGYIRNLLIEDIYAEACHCFVRLLSIHSEVGNIIIRDVRGGTNVRAINGDAARYCRTPMIDVNDPAYTRGVGHMHDVVVDGMSVKQLGKTPQVQVETNADNFVIYNYERPGGADEGDTLFIRHISPSYIKLYGITEAQFTQLTADSKLMKCESAQNADGTYNLDIETDYYDSLVLRSSGFKYFAQNRVR